MQSSSANEIKALEERLKSDPASYCFAQLSALYINAGLLDDALITAINGTARHPSFVAGQMALARASQKKGMPDEARKALETVISAMPENVEAQRMLARLHQEAGRYDEAIYSLQTLIDFSPNDEAAKKDLELLKKRQHMPLNEDDLELIELTDADIFEEPEGEDLLVERVKPVAPPVEDPWSAISISTSEQQKFEEEKQIPTSNMDTDLQSVWSGSTHLPIEASEPFEFSVPVEKPEQDPMNTATLAELYVSQGLPEKALVIYRRIVADNPLNQEAAARVAALEQQIMASEAIVAAVEPPPAPSLNLPEAGKADQNAVVSVLEGWLENIRRLKACH